jgi:hypothetical protein
MSLVGVRELGTARYGETHSVWILGEVGRSGVGRTVTDVLRGRRRHGYHLRRHNESLASTFR